MSTQLPSNDGPVKVGIGDFRHIPLCCLDPDHRGPCVSAPPQLPTKVVPDGGGMRKDEGKNMLDLIPPEWIWGLGEVLTQGAEKYAVRNWERGMKWSKMIGCGLRHVFKFACGERYDPESGCHHLLHASWNFLSLMTYDLRKIGENDLPTFAEHYGIGVIADTMDPAHPRTQRLRKLAQDRIDAAHKPKE